MVLLLSLRPGFDLEYLHGRRTDTTLTFPFDLRKYTKTLVHTFACTHTHSHTQAS